ncbi:MAG: PD-(D/E)XK nuclease family protein [Alphaproteobacteria bacterium]|nr:PD-(D/E)XK nuclease family protein [Alphaproteobacteria bacterium]
MNQPNIFDYATSELSQDAVICYLLSFGQEQYKDDFPKEYSAAHNFLRKCGLIDENIIDIKHQYSIKGENSKSNKIDILVITDNYILIIEDKTYTKEHSDQIIRYVKALKKDKLSQNREIKVCYYKTGDYVYEYKTSNPSILPQENCCSFKRKHIIDILKNNCSDNLILKSYYLRLNSVEERIKSCDDTDIMTWNSEKWFDYLFKIMDGHLFDIGWVHNQSGGFYGCWFDGYKVPSGEDYKQIEISFANGKTSRVKLCYKFSGENKKATLNSKALIKDLQQKAVAKKFIAANRKGKTTTYAYKYAKCKNDVEEFIKNP